MPSHGRASAAAAATAPESSFGPAMFRALMYSLAILHLGPGIAFATLAFGCSDAQPLLGALCAQDQLRAFAGITLGAWLALTAGLALYLKLTRKT